MFFENSSSHSSCENSPKIPYVFKLALPLKKLCHEMELGRTNEKWYQLSVQQQQQLELFFLISLFFLHHPKESCLYVCLSDPFLFEDYIVRNSSSSFCTKSLPRLTAKFESSASLNRRRRKRKKWRQENENDMRSLIKFAIVSFFLFIGFLEGTDDTSYSTIERIRIGHKIRFKIDGRCQSSSNLSWFASHDVDLVSRWKFTDASRKSWWVDLHSGLYHHKINYTYVLENN